LSLVVNTSAFDYPERLVVKTSWVGCRTLLTHLLFLLPHWAVVPLRSQIAHLSFIWDFVRSAQAAIQTCNIVWHAVYKIVRYVWGTELAFVVSVACRPNCMH